MSHRCLADGQIGQQTISLDELGKGGYLFQFGETLGYVGGGEAGTVPLIESCDQHFDVWSGGIRMPFVSVNSETIAKMTPDNRYQEELTTTWLN